MMNLLTTIVLCFCVGFIDGNSINVTRFKRAGSEESWQLFHSAVRSGDVQKIEDLLRNGTDINIKNLNGTTPLIFAAHLGQDDVVDFLIKNGVDINLKDNSGRAPIYVASIFGHDRIVEILIKNDADVNVRDNKGYTPISTSAQEGHLKVVEILLRNGADVNSQNFDGVTPLYFASKNGHDTIVEFLIKNGANVNFKSNRLSTPLHAASFVGQKRVVDILIENNADVNIKDIDGYTPIILAVLEGHLQVSELLLKNGAKVNIKNNDGISPLYLASTNGNDKQVELLLKNGADSNLKGSDGMSSILKASSEGHERIVDLLIKNGADVNIKNKDGFTAIMQAAEQGHKSIVKLLLKNRADGYLRNRFDENALDLAIKGGYKDIIELLQNDLGIRSAEKACKIYLSDIVINGDKVSSRTFKWMAALGYVSNDLEVSFDCGGIIISPYFVLTAAHCVTKRPAVIRLGAVTLIDNDRRWHDYQIRRIFKHPDYSFNTKKNDIALIKVTKPIRFTDEIGPACLETDPRDQPLNVNLSVTGLGLTMNQNSTSRINHLKEVQLITMPLEQCNSTVIEWNQGINDEVFQDGLIESQYCAYDPAQKSDSCKGDSGGPLQYFHNFTSVAKVVGIVSFGIVCGKTSQPSVYTRVAYYLHWIETIVWPNGEV